MAAALIPGAVYLAAAGFEAEVAAELARDGRRIEAWHGRLALSPDPPGPCVWALETWTAPVLLAAPSIGAAATALRAIQRNWALHGVGHHRRAALIAARLPHVAARPLAFPAPAPTAPLGAWTLLEPDRVLASPTKTSPFVDGTPVFREDRAGPPSRAYLKLWEALTRLGAWPTPGQRCLDLGAAPGGWSWALAQLGAAVVAVDRAPLEPRVAALPGVAWRQGSAFGLDPAELGRFDWVVSDVVCYPDRLLGLVRRWIAAGAAGRIVATVKFQGATDHDAVAAFAAIPGAVLFHGAHNKHELTFLWSLPD